MFKKALSLLLAVMLIVTAFSVALVTVAAADGDPADSSSALKVTATSNFFPESTQSFTQNELDANEGYVTVTYFIQSEERLLNLDFLLTYDGTVLEFDEAANKTGSGRNAKLDIVRVADDEVLNTNPQSAQYGIKGNCTNLSTYYLNAEDGGKTAFVTATFKVIGTGDTTVDLHINDMKWTRLEDGQTQSDTKNETVMVEGGNVLDNDMVYVPTTAVYAGQFNAEYVAPETQAPTQAPATQEASEATVAPTTEPAPVVDDDTYVVAGDNAEIFGTSWDAGNTGNAMTKNDDGTYSKSYNAEKAYDVTQLKVVKNGAEWIGDPNGNNVAFAITAPGTFTVTYDPATGAVAVTGDNIADAVFNYETVYAVGNGEGNWLNGASWDPGYAANQMTKVADGVFEIEFTNVPDGFERQIKFAIDGAWTYNFGAPKENAPEFVSGTTFDAAWDGGNITFDTDDTCDVKAQLELREFDFISKTGAKYTITITEKGNDPQPSTEPSKATQPATEPAPPIGGDGFTVVATSNFFPETRTLYPNISDYEDEKGDMYVTVNYKMAAPGKYLINLDVDELTWDPSVLEFKEEYNKFGSGRSAVFSIFPFAVEQGRGAGMINTFGDNNGGRLVGNYTSVSPAAYATEEDGSAITVVRATFKVLDKDAKITTVNCKLDTLSLCDETIKEPYAQDMPIEKCVINPDAYNLGTYETVNEPAGEDVPVDPTQEPSASVPEEGMATVTGSSNFCASVNGQVVKVGENVTVTFKAPKTYDVVDLQWGMDFDEAVLDLVGVNSFTNDMLVNMAAESFDVMGSVTNITSPYAVAEGDDFVSFTFTTKAEAETDVVFTVVDMTVKNEDNDEIIFINGVDQRDAADDTLIVAGDTAEIFGTAWDSANDTNTMTKGEDGKYTKTYTTDKAYAVVQLKAVKNGTEWIGDDKGNNVAFAVTGPGTFTVTYDPETNTVTVTGENVGEAVFNYTDVYAVGNGEGTWLNGIAWTPDAEANKMNKVSDGVFEIEFKNVPDGFERQIKFAIDGAWTYNFGAPKEDAPVIESGVTYDAVWDGGNVTFDTDDLCNVKVQLDLRDFDFVNKTGAKYTVTITDAEPTIPTDDTTPTEDTTPTGDTSTTEDTTPTGTAAESVYIVGGSEKEIFGTEMDGNDPNNQMTLVEGKYVKEYTVEKEFSNVKVRTFIDGTASANEVLFDVTKAGSFKVVYDPEKKLTSVEGDNIKVTPETTGSDATSATSTTSKSSSGSSSSTTSTTTTTTSSNGAVQTGTASMAVIILLVLVSATAGIYFARKRVK